MNQLPATVAFHASLPAFMRDPSVMAEASSLGAMFASRAFPRVSIEGNRFSLILTDGTVLPVNQLDPKTGTPFIDVVFIAWRPNVTKTWYAEGYVQGQESEPACFSMDGVRPDPSSAQPQSATCAACPKNAFGSGGNGRGKACGDKQRTVILLASDTPVINTGAAQVLKAYDQVFGWSLPPMTGKNLAAIVKQAVGAGVNIKGVRLRATFESQGVVNFAFVGPDTYLTEAAYKRGISLATRDEAQMALGADPTPAPAPAAALPPPPAHAAVSVPQQAPTPVPPAAAPFPVQPAAPVAVPAAEPRRRGRPPATAPAPVAPAPVAAAAPFATPAPAAPFAPPPTNGVIQMPAAADPEMEALLADLRLPSA